MIARKKKKNQRELISQKHEIFINIANKHEDFSKEIPESYFQYQFDDKNFIIQCCRSSKLSKDELEKILLIIKTNMKELYEKSEWGWSVTNKSKEITHKNAYILLVKEKLTHQIVAFAHFRFEFDDNHYKSAIYCYELQIIEDFQRKGIGKHLMEILYLLGKKFKMNKVLLTCFVHNQNAMNFYIKKLGYHIDQCSPSRCVEGQTFYEILSLKIC